MHYWINPLTDPRWPGFIDRHPSSSVFHTREWLQALHKTYGYETLAVTQSQPDSDLVDAIPFCRIRSLLTGTRLVSLPFSDHCDPLSATEALLQALPGICALGKLKYVELRPLSPGETPGLAVSQRCLFHAIDLRPELEQIRRKFHTDCVLRKIRRAEREQLTVEEGASEKLLDDFYNLQVLTRKRHGLPPQPRAWFRNLLEAMGERASIRVARANGRALAAILTLRHRRTAVYKYGCSDTAANNLGGMQLLLWKAIEDAKNRGMESMDLGRCDLGDESLAVFKERWGAVRKEIAYLRYPDCADRKVTLGFLSRLPGPLLIAAGRILYRHMA
jgi:CelD/BcsL family acetyltransferase involved in cellulose biosynthesis